MLSLGQVLSVTSERADVRVWLAQGGVVDIEVAAVNAHLLTAGAVVAVAFVGAGLDNGVALGAIDGSAAAAALGHGHDGVRVVTAAERDALAAADGMLVYNSTTNMFEGRAAGAWVALH
jgi:hypothetical protein